MDLAEVSGSPDVPERLEIVFTDELMAILLDRLKQQGMCLVQTDDLLQLLQKEARQEARLVALEKTIKRLETQFQKHEDKLDTTDFMVSRLDRDLEVVEVNWHEMISMQTHRTERWLDLSGRQVCRVDVCP